VTLTSYDEFCGFGGSSLGFEAILGVETILAANHAKIAVEVHALNFLTADHLLGDITKKDVTKLPRADLFWSCDWIGPAFGHANVTPDHRSGGVGVR